MTTDPKFPDELIERVAEYIWLADTTPCAEAHFPGLSDADKTRYRAMAFNALTTAHKLGYATPVPCREAAAQIIQQDLDSRNWQAWKVSAYRDAIRLLRQADPAPPAPMEPETCPAHDLIEPCAQCRVIGEATTPPAEPVTRAEIHTLGQVARCIQSVLCEMGGDSYVLWAVANEYLDDLGIGHAGETAKIETPNEKCEVMPDDAARRQRNPEHANQPDVDTPASGDFNEDCEKLGGTHLLEPADPNGETSCVRCGRVFRVKPGKEVGDLPELVGAVSAGGSSTNPGQPVGNTRPGQMGGSNSGASAGYKAADLSRKAGDEPSTKAALELGQKLYEDWLAFWATVETITPSKAVPWEDLGLRQKAAWAAVELEHERAVAARARREAFKEAATLAKEWPELVTAFHDMAAKEPRHE